MTSISKNTTAKTMKQNMDTLIQDLKQITQNLRPISTPKTNQNQHSRPNNNRVAQIQKWILQVLTSMSLHKKAHHIVRLERLIHFNLVIPLTRNLIPIQNLTSRTPIITIEHTRHILSTNQTN